MSTVTPMTDVFRLSSAATGKTLEITVAGPLPGTGGAPPRLFYVVDPKYYIGAAIDLARGMNQNGDIAPLMVVGVGTPLDTHRDYVGYTMQTRQGLLVPPDEGINSGIMGSLPDQPAPEAHRFLRFIADELDPLLRSRYSVSSLPGGLFGHSYGGLFAAYALIEQLAIFDSYILSSTGMIENRPMLRRVCDAPPGSLQGRVFLGLGEHEDAYAKAYTGQLGATWHRLCQALAPARHPGIQLRSEVQEGHAHGSVAFINLTRGLRWLYDPAGN